MADRELQTILNSGEVNTIFLGGATSADAVKKKSELDATYVNLAGSSAATKALFDPQVTPPAYNEGQIYYDSVKETFVGQGPYSDAAVDFGHTSHTHVINNSGGLIEKGMAVRHNGVDASGNVQIVKAIATSFTNSEIFGVAQHDIADSVKGAITTFGEIFDLDTSLLAAGVPLYLSDTIAGTYSTTAPDIVSRVGGVTKSDATTGVLFVSTVNNTNLPTIYGGIQGQTSPTYAITTTAQDIINYSTKTESVVTCDTATGIITLPNVGAYRLNFTADISFPTSTSTRSVILEVYDVTGAAISYSYTKNIPRDATSDGFSFSFPAQAVLNNQIKMRIKSSTAISVTFNTIVFDIESVSIR